MATHNLLCLRCRSTGHIVKDCKINSWGSEYHWMFSNSRKLIGFGSAWRSPSSKHPICQRCHDLDLIGLLNSYPPWKSQDQLTRAFEEGHELIRSLGKTGTITFWEDCWICKCLFAMTPNPSSSDQEVLLFPDWTICRVSGETGINLDTEEKRSYGTCLIAALKPSSLSAIPFPIRAHRGDALCLLESDLESRRTLGGRCINQDQIDISLVRQWLSLCSRLHGTACTPLFTDELRRTRLVDVESGKIVNHPGHDCDYVALSYVWGEVEQRSYKVRDRVKELPRTLEDSIIFTKKLGKRYLWADSLCIDQADHSEKDDQIQRMRSIYRGAYLTIIALSGSSAKSGLSRVGRTDVYQQMTCFIDGKRLVGLMPTLSQQVWVSPWGQRAWTFQESRLSPRCLLISDHQLYFECKAIQWSESLEHRRSWAHNLSVASNPTTDGFETWMLDQGGSGCFRHSVDSHAHRLNNYGCGVNLYTSRKMKNAEDGLNAFTGMLQTFGNLYPKGFIEGLPIEDLDWGLLWRSRDPPLRRVGFPSWCWAGWEGGVWYGQPIDHTKPRRFPVNLEIQRVNGTRLESIFHTSTRCADDGTGISFIIQSDPVDIAAREDLNKPEFCPDAFPEEIRSRLLVIDAISFTFMLDFRKPRHRAAVSGQYGLFQFPVRGKKCFIQIMSTDKEISSQQEIEKTFVLVARDHISGFIVHHLLLVYVQEHSGITERGTALELLVPLDHLDILDELKPKRRRIMLG